MRGILEIQPPHGATALEGSAATGVVDDDLAHGDGGDREEMAPVVPVGRGAIEQADVRLVHQRRRVERDVTRVGRQAAVRHRVQLLVDQGEQRLDGPAATIPQHAQDLGDFVPGHDPSVLEGGNRRIGDLLTHLMMIASLSRRAKG